MSSPWLLLTGFEPFGGDTLNPSWELARALDGQTIGTLRVRALALPCAFGHSLALLDDALRRWRPHAVVCLGLAAGRAELSVERVAINIDDAPIPDNAGHQPKDQAVIADGPAAYFSRLPIKAMVAASRAQGVPAGVSQTAGTFVCNHVFYGLLHRWRRRPARPAGFIHVPLLPEMRSGPTDSRPALALEQQGLGLRAMLGALSPNGEAPVADGGAVN
jgi:pyroglutamyl-peptidase